jgi:peptide chain release factor 1
MDLLPFIEKFRRRFDEVEALLGAPDAFSNAARGQELTREHSRLRQFVADGDAWVKVHQDLTDNRELLASEMAGSEMAAANAPSAAMSARTIRKPRCLASSAPRASFRRTS